MENSREKRKDRRESLESKGGEGVERRRASLNEITGAIVDASLRVHKKLGPGGLESSYQRCLAIALRKRGHRVIEQMELPIEYEGFRIDVGYRVDQLVDDQVIVELKATKRLLPVHEAQLISYLRLSGRRVGLLINFHEIRLKDGIRRLVNNF